MFSRVLGRETVVPPPIWLMRQAGRYLPEYRELRGKAPDFLKFCYSPKLAVEATLQPIRRFDLDAAIVFSDILVIPDALGCRVHFQEGVGPLVAPLEELDEIGPVDPLHFLTHLEPVYETIATVKGRLEADVALIGFAGAPWTLATYLIEGRGGSDFANTKRRALAEPAAFAYLIDVLVEATVLHLVRQLDAGADAVQIFDSWAGVLSETEFRKWVITPSGEIVRRVREAKPGAKIIGFPRGAGPLYIDFALDTGVDAVSLDSAVPLAWVAAKLQGRVAVQGNLDNTALLVGGDVMREASARILDTLGAGSLIFNLGHGVLPATPPDHVAELVALVRAWNGS
ncbi:MAG: uroporphyrinogen decarboxylase [Rhodospirillales bacterium]|nr:uroporphyrinogen decarboxylase [Rhodospirillales bacterium]